jgi:3-methyladenine DNA glycosylase AlkD
MQRSLGTAEEVKHNLSKKIDTEKAQFLPRFFKTGKGQYGEGDIFIGVTVPNQRIVAKMFKDLPLKEISRLLKSKIHEHRLTGLIILVNQYKKTKITEDKKRIFDFYIEHLDSVNNWDLVDSSAGYIAGHFLLDKNKQLLYTYAHSKNLWERRIAIIATQYFISQKKFDDTLEIAEILLHDSEDLIHKAVGWMLREIGKINQDVEEEFLKKNYKIMPRTMLRYAIEKFDAKKKMYYMKKD